MNLDIKSCLSLCVGHKPFFKLTPPPKKRKKIGPKKLQKESKIPFLFKLLFGVGDRISQIILSNAQVQDMNNKKVSPIPIPDPIPNLNPKSPIPIPMLNPKSPISIPNPNLQSQSPNPNPNIQFNPKFNLLS